MPNQKKDAKRHPSNRAPVGSVGWRIRELRLNKNPPVTQGMLAKAAGVSVQSVSELERGDTKSPTPDNLFAYAELLGVNPHYLATGRGNQDPITVITPDEGELLILFRDLDDLSRADLLGYARGLQKKKRHLAPVTPLNKAG